MVRKSSLVVPSTRYNWIILIFMGTLALEHVLITANTSTYYQAVYIRNISQPQDMTSLYVFHHLHACSINSTCSYVVKDMKNKFRFYNSRDEIPANEEVLTIWMRNTRHYGYRLFTVTRTWHEAREVCQLYGGDLASVASKQDEEKINQLLSAFVNHEGFWFGLNDIETEGTYVWSDGSEYVYTNWKDGEPNNSGGNEDCMLAGLGMKWVDAPCGGKAYSVCRIALV